MIIEKLVLAVAVAGGAVQLFQNRVLVRKASLDIFSFGGTRQENKQNVLCFVKAIISQAQCGTSFHFHL